MAQHDIGSLVVMDHGRMVGMLTFAEVLRGAGRSGKGTLGDRQGQRDHGARSADRDHRTRRDASCGGRCSSGTRATCPVMDGADAARRRIVPRRRQGGATRSRASRTGCSRATSRTGRTPTSSSLRGALVRSQIHRSKSPGVNRGRARTSPACQTDATSVPFAMLHRAPDDLFGRQGQIGGDAEQRPWPA